jgi:hypothetical protein
VNSFRSGSTSDVEDNHLGHPATPETVTMLVTLMLSFKNTRNIFIHSCRSSEEYNLSFISDMSFSRKGP